MRREDKFRRSSHMGLIGLGMIRTPDHSVQKEAIQTGFEGAHPSHQWTQITIQSCYLYPAR